MTSTLIFSACSVDLDTGEVRGSSSPSRLTPLERRLLAYLAQNQGTDVATDALLSEVWGYSEGVVTRAVAASVGRLRAKIERNPRDPDHILTVHGAGFRLELPEVACPAAVSLDRFYGRTSELAAVRGALDSRLVTLVGPGGIGKTRLARELGGDVWCACVEDSDAAALARRLATALSVGAGRTGTRLAADLGSALASLGPTRLILDNLEQVVDAAAGLVRQWLDAAPALVIVATSREPLRVAGEHVIELGPLEVGAGVALFMDRARETEMEGVDCIVERLNGLPLAIELAAGWTGVLTVPALLDRLSDPLEWLVSDRRDRDPRHRTMTAVLKASWDLLSPSESAGLERLCTLRGSFSLADAEALGVAASTVRSLRAKSLLQDRLQLSESVRMYGEARARAAGTWEASTEAHRRWLVRGAAGYDPTANAPSAADRQWAIQRLDDLHWAWREALASDPAAAAWLAVPLHVHHWYSGPVQVCDDVLTRTLDRCPDPLWIGHLLRYRCHARHLLGQIAAALEDVEAALKLALSLGDPTLEGRCHSAVMVVAVDGADYAKANRHFEWASAAHDRAGDTAGLASSLANQATVCWFTGRLDEAVAGYRRATALHLQHGNERSAATAMGNCAMVETERGHDAMGLEMLERVLGLHRDLDDRMHEASTQVHIGRLHNKCGRFEQGRQSLARAAEIYRHYQASRDRLAGALQHQGIAHQLQGAHALARPFFEEAISLWESEGRPHRFVDLELLLLRAQSGEALPILGELEQWEPHDEREQSFLLLMRGLVRLELGQDARAEAVEAREALAGELKISEAWLYLAQLEAGLFRSRGALTRLARP